jgi:hypothetical protein
MAHPAHGIDHHITTPSRWGVFDIGGGAAFADAELGEF